MNQRVTLTRQALKTPRAAAVAGIIFAVLFTISIVLMRLAIPEELSGTNTAAWLQGNTTTLTLALTLVPFAGIAFLWFIGVVRDRLGKLEDQFFSTVFFGSGLLFLAMVFASAAIAGGILSSYALEPGYIDEERCPCFWASDYVHDYESVCHSHGWRVHDCVGHHLDAHPCDAALVCVPILRAGIDAAGEQRPYRLVDSCLSGMGVCD